MSIRKYMREQYGEQVAPEVDASMKRSHDFYAGVDSLGLAVQALMRVYHDAAITDSTLGFCQYRFRKGLVMVCGPMSVVEQVRELYRQEQERDSKGTVTKTKKGERR